MLLKPTNATSLTIAIGSFAIVAAYTSVSTLVAFEATSPKIEASELVDEQDASNRLREKIAAIQETIHRLTTFRTDFGFDLDGGFEQNFENGSQEKKLNAPLKEVVKTESSSWRHSLNPTSTWTTSTQFHRSGEKSLGFTSTREDSLGWIQTRPIPRRFSWPIAVEVWIRTDLDQSVPTVRLISTGVKNGVRTSQTNTVITGSEPSKNIDELDPLIDSQVQQVWKRFEFPLVHHAKRGILLAKNEAVLELSPDELLHWTIEVTGKGKTWIDDVGLCPLALSDEERRLFRGQLFVANRELEQGNLQPAIDWVESPLVRRLMQLSSECPPDFLRPVQPVVKPATVKRPALGWVDSMPTLGNLIRR